uniref:Amino acid transporter transmembrane domain-containing protein n=1 Tax=Globisporangium ultimum (strain ATCC 200006 / CBS 805.95 / DAOM BR144) TaxID=431595 RepID=K3WJN2_GLOUD
MPANFSRAGPVIATFALIFMAFANIYSGVACSKVMLAAPNRVKTFGDLGEWCMGKTGRYLVVTSQMGVCLLVPCAFLVLGGTLLQSLFPDTFESSTWIILMAVAVMPVCLTPTLKEGAGAAFAGCVGTLIADVIGVAVLLHGMSGHPSVPTPDISFKQVATTFGNLSLAYGATIVIPALQRQHSDPTRMPRIVGVTLTFISVLFLALAGSGYSAVGCQISGNLLFTIFPDPVTGLSKLGFTSNKGMVVLAYLCMQLHITIAFAVIVSPAFYIAERLVLGMHQKRDDDLQARSYESINTPAESKSRTSKNSVVSIADIEKESLDEEIEAAEYTGAFAWKYALLRTCIVCIQVISSVFLRDHFLDLNDFIGASCMTMSCIILPITFYLKKLWTNIPAYEKIAAIVVIIVCLVFGCYVTYTSGKNIIDPDDSDPKILFPFCHPKDEREIYYNATAGL